MPDSVLAPVIPIEIKLITFTIKKRKKCKRKQKTLKCQYMTLSTIKL